MNKPDWKDAPWWANYLAMDANGVWCWFADKPRPHYSGWACGDKFEVAGVSPGWRNSLEGRP